MQLELMLVQTQQIQDLKDQLTLVQVNQTNSVAPPFPPTLPTIIPAIISTGSISLTATRVISINDTTVHGLYKCVSGFPKNQWDRICFYLDLASLMDGHPSLPSNSLI